MGKAALSSRAQKEPHPNGHISLTPQDENEFKPNGHISLTPRDENESHVKASQLQGFRCRGASGSREPLEPLRFWPLATVVYHCFGWASLALESEPLRDSTLERAE
jgi:hypothetical protein